MRIACAPVDRGAKFRRSLEQAGFTPAAFARRIGGTPQLVNSWLLRGVPQGRTHEVGKILRKNPEWLASTEIGVPEEPVSQSPVDPAIDAFLRAADHLSEEQIQALAQVARLMAKR